MAVQLAYHRVLLVFLAVLMGLVVLRGAFDDMARALPAPKTAEELFEYSDLVVKGYVSRVCLYGQWLSELKSGAMGERGMAFAGSLPDTDDGLLDRMMSFPCRSSRAPIDGVHVAEIMIEQVYKGESEGLIFIPFIRCHPDGDSSMEGGWSERIYTPGEHLFLNLRQNGPLYESTWWNAVNPVE